MKIKNLIICLMMMVLLSLSVTAVTKTMYNPFTSKLDYVQDLSNQSGQVTVVGNLTADYFWLNNAPADCSGGTYTTYWNGSDQTCIAAMRTTGENVTGNYNITGNVTAGYFIGDGTQLTGVLLDTGDTATGNYTFDGNITADFYFGNGVGLDGMADKLWVNESNNATYRDGNIEIGNDLWLRAQDNATTSYVNMFKINDDDKVQLGGTLLAGLTEFTEDSDEVRWVNMPVSASGVGGQGYSFAMDNVDAFKVYSDPDGSGGVDNLSVVIAPTGGGNADRPSLAFGVGEDTGIDEYTANELGISIAGARKWLIYGDVFGANGAMGGTLLNEVASSTNPTVLSARGDLDLGLGRAGANELSLIAGAVEGIRIDMPSESIVMNYTVKFQAIAQPSCNVTHEGGIYYNGSDYTHYGCNSTDWNALY